MQNKSIEQEANGQPSKTTPRLSCETVGRHNAIVFYSGEGSKIILCEDVGMCDAKERAAYFHLAPIVRAYPDLLKALKLIASSESFMGGTFTLELQQIARAAIAKAQS